MASVFHFAFARLGATSLWIDYVNTESNLADIPSRFHEMSAAEASAAAADLGERIDSIVPTFASDDGQWLPFADIARSVWG